MIKTNTSRWYDVECDGDGCERLASMDYGHCLGWATPTQAVDAALEARWERREENGIEHMYCYWCRQLLPQVRYFEKKYTAVCKKCGNIERPIKAESIYEAVDKLMSIGWKFEWDFGSGTVIDSTCPDCAKKGQAK